MPGKDGYKYVYSAGHIDEVFRRMKDAGRPDRLTPTYALKNWNLPNNDQYSAVIELLKSMQFLDSTGVPQELYAEFQNPSLAKRAVAKGIKNAYPNLFKVYPKAYEMRREELSGFIRQNTGADITVVRRTAATLEKLFTWADFSDNEDQVKVEPETEPTKKAPHTPVVKHQGGYSSAIPITMNIQIVIPNDASEEQYDKIFSSIKKFLTPTRQPDEEQS